MCINKEHKFEEGYALMIIASNPNEIYNITTSLIKHSKDAIDKITTIEEKLRKDNLSYIDELIKEKLAFGFVALSTIAIKEYDYSIGKLSQKRIDELMKRKIKKELKTSATYDKSYEAVSDDSIFGVSFKDIKTCFRIVRNLIIQTTMKENVVVLFNEAIKELYTKYNCEVVQRIIAISTLFIGEQKLARIKNQ